MGERSDREAIRVRGYSLKRVSEPPHPNPLPNGERERAVPAQVLRFKKITL
jgi:hypothetical protein